MKNPKNADDTTVVSPLMKRRTFTRRIAAITVVSAIELPPREAKASFLSAAMFAFGYGAVVGLSKLIADVVAKRRLLKRYMKERELFQVLPTFSNSSKYELDVRHSGSASVKVAGLGGLVLDQVIAGLSRHIIDGQEIFVPDPRGRMSSQGIPCFMSLKDGCLYESVRVGPDDRSHGLVAVTKSTEKAWTLAKEVFKGGPNSISWLDPELDRLRDADWFPRFVRV